VSTNGVKGANYSVLYIPSWYRLALLLTFRVELKRNVWEFGAFKASGNKSMYIDLRFRTTYGISNLNLSTDTIYYGHTFKKKNS
jgi:hypothetical protein